MEVIILNKFMVRGNTNKIQQTLKGYEGGKSWSIEFRPPYCRTV